VVPRGWELINADTLASRCSGASHESFLRELEQAVRSNPKDAALAQRLGFCHERAGNTDAAERTYQAAIALYPDRVLSADHSLAHLYQMRRDFAKAEKVLRAAYAKNPDNYEITLKLADLLAEGAKKPDEAVTLAQKAVAMEPEDPDALSSLGWAYYRKGDQAHAVKYIGEAARRNPARYNWLLEEIGRGAGTRTRSRTTMRRSARIQPTLPRSRDGRRRWRSRFNRTSPGPSSCSRRRIVETKRILGYQ
jgi:tetratricopeptide (TPR) repeat protein